MTFPEHDCCTQRNPEGHDASWEVLLLIGKASTSSLIQSGLDTRNGVARQTEAKVSRATRHRACELPVAKRV
jgi:hypothetical protein